MEELPGNGRREDDEARNHLRVQIGYLGKSRKAKEKTREENVTSARGPCHYWDGYAENSIHLLFLGRRSETGSGWPEAGCEVARILRRDERGLRGCSGDARLATKHLVKTPGGWDHFLKITIRPLL